MRSTGRSCSTEETGGRQAGQEERNHLDACGESGGSCAAAGCCSGATGGCANGAADDCTNGDACGSAKGEREMRDGVATPRMLWSEQGAGGWAGPPPLAPVPPPLAPVPPPLAGLLRWPLPLAAKPAPLAGLLPWPAGGGPGGGGGSLASSASCCTSSLAVGRCEGSTLVQRWMSAATPAGHSCGTRGCRMLPRSGRSPVQISLRRARAEQRGASRRRRRRRRRLAPGHQALVLSPRQLLAAPSTPAAPTVLSAHSRPRVPHSPQHNPKAVHIHRGGQAAAAQQDLGRRPAAAPAAAAAGQAASVPGARPPQQQSHCHPRSPSQQ